jgi:hypothetical protein
MTWLNQLQYGVPNQRMKLTAGRCLLDRLLATVGAFDERVEPGPTVP